MNGNSCAFLMNMIVLKLPEDVLVVVWVILSFQQIIPQTVGLSIDLALKCTEYILLC